MLNKQTLLTGIVALVTGLVIGWMTNPSESMNHEHSTTQEHQTWTCSMHPQIQQPESGDCPLCGMDLIPMTQEESDNQRVSVQMSSTAIQLANVQTTMVQKQVPEKSLRVSGMVKVAENQKHALTAHISGRIERLMVGFEGETIQKGQILAWVYSPELLTAQKELLEAWRNRGQSPRLYQSVRAKMLNWKMTDKQIDQILKQGTPQEEIPIYADVTGTILRKNVLVGDHVHSGEVLVEAVDLSSIWVEFDVYESDLSWVHLDDEVEFHSKSRPNQTLSGSISFIAPMIDPKTRTATVRVEVPNPEGLFKPAEFVIGRIHTTGTDALLVPKSSVLWTGKRSIVYVKDQQGSFVMRPVQLGSSLDNDFIVLDGLREGEEVVTYGAFSVDSTAQLQGRPSMMNMPEETVSTEVIDASLNSVEFSDAAKHALHPLYTVYLELKTALVNDDFETAHQKAISLRSVSESIPRDVFTDSSHSIWLNYANTLESHIRVASDATSLNEIRMAFKPLSETMIALSNVVGSVGIPLYIQYCPMADNNQGADWLSSESEIRNPYFGASMLGCGELKSDVQ